MSRDKISCDELSWIPHHTHVHETCTAASKILGFMIVDCKGYISISSMLSLYYALVQTKLGNSALVFYRLCK